MIELKKLSCSYGKRSVLNGIDLLCPDGSITALLGINGSGKTTLARCVQGIIPYSGSVLFEGETDPRDRSKQLSVLPQELPAPAVSVAELVLFGRTPYLGFYGIPCETDLKTADNAMRQLGILHLAEQPVNTLSGGQRQKAFLAMLLAQNTRNIILDEPSSFMDAVNERAFYTFCDLLRSRGKSILLIQHQIDRALNHADAVAVLDCGRIQFHGSPDACVASGILSDLFGIRLHRFKVDGKERYFCS